MKKASFFTGKIIHLVPTADWEKALSKGHYHPASLDREGFIHFSTYEHALETADLYYKDEEELVALVVVNKWVKQNLVWEPGRDGVDFPHLYAELSLDKIETTLHVHRNAAGKFEWE